MPHRVRQISPRQLHSKRRNLTKRRKQRRLRLETLELRRVLATFAVTNLLDTGSGSLRDAVAAANGNTGVDLVDIQVPGSILLNSQIQITDSVTIQGLGTNPVTGSTIDAQDGSRIVEITSATSSVTFDGVVLTGGNATGNGGAVASQSTGTLTITNSVVSGNTTDARGGGIQSSGPVVIADGTVQNNVAAIAGGGVYTYGSVADVTVTHSTISGNSSGDGGGGVITYDGDITIESGSLISGNTSHRVGGGISAFNGDVTITDSEVSGNRLTVLGTASGGGGIHHTLKTVNVTNSTISGNYSEDHGGGIYSFNGTVTLTDSTLSMNSTSDRGGGIRISDGMVSITRTTVEGNSADIGGGIDGNTGSITVTDSVVSGNSAIRNGAGVHLRGTLIVTDSELTGNTAGEHGGGFYNGGFGGGNSTVTRVTATHNEAGRGGAFFNRDGLLEVADSTISGNTLNGSLTQRGGGFYASQGTLTVNNTEINGNLGGGIGTSNLNGIIADSSITGNRVSGTNGGGLYAFSGVLDVNNSTISGNQANFGGGVYTRIATVNLTDSVLYGNRATGGGALGSKDGPLVLTRTTVAENLAFGLNGGGAIRARDGSTEVIDSSIINNTSQTNGGGILTDSGEVMITNSTISGNSAGVFSNGKNGGGIYTMSGNVTIANSTVVNNDAGFAGTGGGIFVADTASDGTLTISSSIVARNVSTNSSDLNPDPDAALTVTNSLIGDNSSTTLTENQPPNLPDGDGNFIGTNASPLDPEIGLLGDNGGPSRTHPLLPSSPAIDVGDAGAQTGDQRGFSRSFGGGVDMGAYELHRFFVVDSIGDGGDANPGDGNVDDGSGNATLRAAIEETNALANLAGAPDTIFFDITGSGVHTVTPGSALPAISEAVIIDATSETDYVDVPRIHISGASATGDGLSVTAGDTTLRGLSITGFTSGGGIEFVGGSSNAAELNYLGLDPTGNADGNFLGLRVINSANNVVRDNVISGNNRAGVFLNGTLATGTANVFAGNFIGTDPSGTVARPNVTDGITNQAPQTQIGLPGDGNTISGNARWGILAKGNGRGGIIVQGNRIGVDSAQSAPLPNTIGIHIQNSANLVGGSTLVSNIVGGNSTFGVAISTTGGNENTISGNTIGAPAFGSASLGNVLFGVRVTKGSDNQIGGSSDIGGNVITGNKTGVLLALDGTNRNRIEGNTIGGTFVGGLANSADGVRIVQGASDNIISKNHIAANGGRAISTDQPTTMNNDILFNLIGTDPTGTTPVHNGAGGALRLRSPGSRIEGNTISGPDVGLLAFGNASQLQVVDNYFGTDVSETSITLGMDTAIKIFLGSDQNLVHDNAIANNNKGIVVFNGTGNTITQNSIFANTVIGIDLGDNGADVNDAGDADSGANNLQNSPSLSEAHLGGADLMLSYLVDSNVGASSYPLTIEFFISDNAGQGKTPIGTDQYLSSDAGASKSILLVNPGVVEGQKIVATATDQLGNTSEFGLEFTVTTDV